MPNSSKILKVSNPLYILIFTRFDFLISRTKCYNALFFSVRIHYIEIKKKNLHNRDNLKFTQCLILFIVCIEYFHAI